MTLTTPVSFGFGGLFYQYQYNHCICYYRMYLLFGFGEFVRCYFVCHENSNYAQSLPVPKTLSGLGVKKG